MEKVEWFLNFKLVLSIAVFLLNLVNADLVHKKFEYKYSFKPPYLAQRDGSVPFWEYGGNAIASAENVRIAPSLRSQKGAIWTKIPLNFDWWDIDISFRVTGRGRIGADGLAFWYTQTKGSYDGDVFGSSDMWNGLGIFFDSFDNDNKHNNPYIMAVLNDGTRQFDHQNDGQTQLTAGCLRDFRNKPYLTRARIEYYNNVLTLLFHNGMTNNEQDYEMCFRAENVVLPKGGYFGMSAATGGLADDHDVMHFLTNSLHPQAQQPAGQAGQGEDQQLNKEYLEYQKKLEQQKEDYKKEHPSEVHEPDVEDWFETDTQRELRTIFHGQSQMFDALRDLNRKLDEVVGRQERTLGLISASGGGVGGVGGGAAPGGAAIAGGTGEGIRRHEVETLFNNQNVMSTTLREIRQFAIELKAKADSIINNQARAPTAQVQAVGYDTQALVGELRDHLNQVKQGQVQIQQRLDSGLPSMQAQAQCPTPNCVSLTSLLVVIALHLAVVLGYMLYRDNKENQAKKFY